MPPTSLQVGTGLVKSRRTRSGLGSALGSGIAVRLRRFGVQPRMPSPRISLRTRYGVNPENSAGREHSANLAPNLRSDSSQTRPTASRSADRSSSGQPLESHE